MILAKNSFSMFLDSLNFYKNASKFFLYNFLILLLMQLFFWWKTESIKPKVNIIPPVPNKHAIEALSLGDKEFYFRVLALKIQNAGDSFGRFTALKYYDYDKLYKWFKILDSLNHKSKFVPSLAAYYYAQTQNKADTIYIVRYLDEYASRDIDENWWWMFQATYLAYKALDDYDLALKLAYKLKENQSETAPLWTKQFPAFLHARLGEDCTAFFIIEQILKDHKLGIRKLSPRDIEVMKYFVEVRLSKLKKEKFNPAKCRK